MRFSSSSSSDITPEKASTTIVSEKRNDCQTVRWRELMAMLTRTDESMWSSTRPAKMVSKASLTLVSLFHCSNPIVFLPLLILKWRAMWIRTFQPLHKPNYLRPPRHLQLPISHRWAAIVSRSPNLSQPINHRPPLRHHLWTPTPDRSQQAHQQYRRKRWKTLRKLGHR